MPSSQPLGADEAIIQASARAESVSVAGGIPLRYLQLIRYNLFDAGSEDLHVYLQKGDTLAIHGATQIRRGQKLRIRRTLSHNPNAGINEFDIVEVIE